MAIMEARRTRSAGRRVSRWVPPLEPGTVDDLLRFREQLGEDYRRDEIIEGLLVVSPLATRWHQLAVKWLLRSLQDLCDENGWEAADPAEIELPQNRDRIQPDVVVFRDADSLPLMDNLMPLDHVLLVAEVVSPSSIRIDREVKPSACARAGIPLYLLVDRFTDPLSVTLYSEPGDQGYATVITVGFGDKLRIPAPFDITIDTSALPLPR
jgi:Uma2 family endonuclease